MARNSFSKAPKVNLTKYVQLLGRGWRYCAVVYAPNGRIKPDAVRVDGKTEKHEEGTYCIEWRWQGKRHRKAVGTSAVVAENERQMKERELGAVAVGLLAPTVTTGRVTVADAISVFLDEAKLKSKSTADAYSVALRYFEEFCSKRYLDDVDRRDAIAFSTFLMERKGHTARTACNKLNIVRQLLKANGRTGVILSRELPRYVQAVTEIYTEDELRRLLGRCNPRHRLLFEFFLKTGFRDQEVKYCAWSDVDFANNVVRVTAKPKWGFVPKTWEEREVPVPTDLIGRLREALSRSNNKGPFVFSTANGRPMHNLLRICKSTALRAGLNCGSCVSKKGKRCAESATCEHWFLHKFRATFATLLLRGSSTTLPMPVQDVQRLLGHRDIQSTMVYMGHQTSKRLQVGVEAVFGALTLTDDLAAVGD